MSELPVISEIPLIDRKSFYEQRTALFSEITLSFCLHSY